MAAKKLQGLALDRAQGGGLARLGAVDVDVHEGAGAPSAGRKA
jgi:hypothetical protein